MTDTLNFTWTKPTVAGDNNAWGTKLNQALDDVDADLKTILDSVTAAVASAATSDATLTADVQKKKYIPFTAFQPINDEDDVVYAGASVRADNDSGSEFYAGFELPPGVTLDLVELLCDKGAGASVTVAVQAVNAASGALTALGSGTRTTAGVGLASAAIAPAHVVGAEFLSLHVTGASSFAVPYRIYGAIVTYTRHGLTETD